MGNRHHFYIARIGTGPDEDLVDIGSLYVPYLMYGIGRTWERYHWLEFAKVDFDVIVLCTAGICGYLDIVAGPSLSGKIIARYFI